ncbi:MAG: ATP-binding protein [Defluviitaleaceae bacterium]|nr:ATP-binding protein [Defluviitaleaceae bacterium]
MAQNKWSYRFNSDLTRAHQIIRDILKFVGEEKIVLPKEEMSELKLIFSELLHNAIIHGNEGDRAKFVHVDIELKNGVLHACIADEGKGFDTKKVMEKTNSSSDMESGRGIRLVKGLTDSLSYEASGRRVYFCKKLSYR